MAWSRNAYAVLRLPATMPCVIGEMMSLKTIDVDRLERVRARRGGLLNRKRNDALRSWRQAEETPFAHRFEPGVLYIDEENILTSAGGAAGVDLCLLVVRTGYGAEIASGLRGRRCSVAR